MRLQQQAAPFSVFLFPETLCHCATVIYKFCVKGLPVWWGHLQAWACECCCCRRRCYTASRCRVRKSGSRRSRLVSLLNHCRRGSGARAACIAGQRAGGSAPAAASHGPRPACLPSQGQEAATPLSHTHTNTRLVKQAVAAQRLHRAEALHEVEQVELRDGEGRNRRGGGGRCSRQASLASLVQRCCNGAPTWRPPAIRRPRGSPPRAWQSPPLPPACCPPSATAPPAAPATRPAAQSRAAARPPAPPPAPAS